jgi:hypothetical protein
MGFLEMQATKIKLSRARASRFRKEASGRTTVQGSAQQ